MSKDIKTLDPVEVVKRIEKDAKESAPEKPRTVKYGTMSPGDNHWQGDVCIQRIDKLYKDCVEAEPVRKLAPGNSRGSRHLIAEESMKGLKFWARTRGGALDGPVIKVPRGQKMTVEHPDHGTVIMPAGLYRIRYQHQYHPQETRRVLD